jgi:hypothetical protein
VAAQLVESFSTLYSLTERALGGSNKQIEESKTMRRLTFTSVVLTAALASCLASAASAMAETPEFTVETQVTGSSGAGAMTLGAIVVECKKDKVTLTFTSKRTGEYIGNYQECKVRPTNQECTSLGDAKGVILIIGEWKLVIANKTTRTASRMRDYVSLNSRKHDLPSSAGPQKNHEI